MSPQTQKSNIDCVLAPQHPNSWTHRKAQWWPLMGKLEPLLTPDQCWDTISMDFIVELPEAHRYDAVMNMVDSVSKRSHLILTTTIITARRAAQLYMSHMWKLHSFKRQVVLDWGPQFIVDLSQELCQLLGIKLAATTAYHPQGDGQTERVNQELEQYLWLFINEWQDDWDELLPLAEFQYNKHMHSTTQQAVRSCSNSDLQNQPNPALNH